MRWRRASKTSQSSHSKGYSLRRRLITTTLGSSVAVGIVSTLIVMALAWKEVSDTFDDTLEEGARLVLALGEGISVGGLTARGRDNASEPALRLDYQIISRDGVVLRRGEDAPKRPFVDPGRRDDRFYDVWVSKKRWRVYIRNHDTLEFSVQIGQEWEDRTDLILDMLESLAWPLIGLWLLLGLVNWWIIRRLVAPLERLAREMEAKSPSDLSALSYDGKAQEVRTVVNSLNRLLGRLSKALENERRFTADAAHELRTPLAALASRTQVMQRRVAAGDVQALSADVQRLREDIARSTALVESLLQLARLDPEAADLLISETIDAPALIDEVVGICAAHAAARGVTVSVHCRVSTLTGSNEGLRTALRNLLHNAISYGRQDGKVEISLVQQGNVVILAVRDDGETLAEADRQRLAQRFFRVLGSGVPGSGLGLSIVARIAELHGGELRFGSGLDGRGLGAELVLPLKSQRRL